MHFENITVQAYSGYKLNERPLSFVWRGTMYRVVDIVDRWYEGSTGSVCLDYFKVSADNGQCYILRYNSLFDAWAIVVPD